MLLGQAISVKRKGIISGLVVFPNLQVLRRGFNVMYGGLDLVDEKSLY
jgi:hypothetical protein